MSLRVGMAVAALCVLVAAPAAQARSIDVHPGPHAISDALAAASDGDVLRVHPGTYGESFTINKRVTLKGVGGARPVIDGQCQTRAPIQIRHGGVTLDHLRVQGADEGFGDFPSEVDFQNVSSGAAEGLHVIDTCDAEYGINAFNTGPVKISDNVGRGFSDSAIYVGSITDTLGGTLLVAHNTATHNSRGIIVEDSFRSTDILVQGNVLNDNTVPNGEGLASDGLYLTNTDGIRIAHNVANDNGGSGFHANSSSDHNHFVHNQASGNSDGPFTDDNGRNCGKHNSFPIPAD